MIWESLNAESGEGSAPRPLLLVVDDEPDLLELMSEALMSQGFRVAKAQHGEEALQRIAEEQPQLILLDMRMPVMDGWTFARIFRERYGHRIPIIVVTAAVDSKARATEVDADSHLGKPFELEELFDVVADTLARWTFLSSLSMLLTIRHRTAIVTSLVGRSA